MAEMGRVRLAEQDRPSSPQSASDRTVEIRYVVLEELRAVGRAQPGRWLEVFDRNGQAVQRPKRTTAQDSSFGGPRRVTRTVGVERDKCVHARLQPLRSFEHVVEHLDGRNTSSADRFDQCGGRRVGERRQVGHRISGIPGYGSPLSPSPRPRRLCSG